MEVSSWASSLESVIKVLSLFTAYPTYNPTKGGSAAYSSKTGCDYKSTKGAIAGSEDDRSPVTMRQSRNWWSY